MKPERIFIVRHGQSQGNVDREIYETIPDYALQLTELGREQATNAGQKIHDIIGNESVQFYVSPFWRTRQTYLGIKKNLHPSSEVYYEDPRLREQEWDQKLGTRERFKDNEERERDSYGHFYYRFDGGESCADVYDRISDFLGTLHRDFTKKEFPKNGVLVNHGMTMRLLLMRWFHYSVEEFETWGNPHNGDYYLLELGDNGKYNLITPPRKHVVRHDYQFDWGNGKPQGLL